ncbi:fatty acid-binding protein DegV, partial [Xanthomonas citri pv. citri]|nr:fatty acid-binding protein DegV [Xanthomonas citri pv. citri]
VDDGAIGLLDRPRSAARAVDRLVELATERAGEDPVRIAVHEYGDPETAGQLAERLQPISTTPVPVVELPAVLAAHLGLGA